MSAWEASSVMGVKSEAKNMMSFLSFVSFLIRFCCPNDATDIFSV